MTFHGWGYPFEDHCRAFEESGLLIEALREPRVPAERSKRSPTPTWEFAINYLVARDRGA